MARGSAAKAEVENIIRNAFGKNFLGVDTSTKKLYVLANDGDEMINIAISMTCPKTPFGVVEDGMNFDATPAKPDVFQPAEMTNEETERVRKLIEKFNL